MSNHQQQVESVIAEHGMAEGIDYARRTLAVYRGAAKFRHPETKRRHFAHVMPYRPHFVASIIYLRKFLKESPAQHGGRA